MSTIDLKVHRITVSRRQTLFASKLSNNYLYIADRSCSIGPINNIVHTDSGKELYCYQLISNKLNTISEYSLACHKLGGILLILETSNVRKTTALRKNICKENVIRKLKDYQKITNQYINSMPKISYYIARYDPLPGSVKPITLGLFNDYGVMPYYHQYDTGFSQVSSNNNQFNLYKAKRNVKVQLLKPKYVGYYVDFVRDYPEMYK